MKNEKLTKIEKREIIIKKVQDKIMYLPKEDLEFICDSLDIKYYCDWKGEILKKIHEAGKKKKMIYMKIYEMYKDESFGMTSKEVEEILNITSYKRKELEKYNILEVLYTYFVKMYGRKVVAPVYVTDVVLDLVGEDTDKLLKEERKS